MLAAIGGLLLFMGFSTFLMAAVRHFFPSLESFVPNDFKRLLNMRVGVYLFLAGVLLLRFF
jgi:hypothetical protein